MQQPIIRTDGKFVGCGDPRVQPDYRRTVHGLNLRFVSALGVECGRPSEFARGMIGKGVALFGPHKGCKKHGGDDQHAINVAMHYHHACVAEGVPTACLFYPDGVPEVLCEELGSHPIRSTLHQLLSDKEGWGFSHGQISAVVIGKHFVEMTDGGGVLRLTSSYLTPDLVGELCSIIPAFAGGVPPLYFSDRLDEKEVTRLRPLVDRLPVVLPAAI